MNYVESQLPDKGSNLHPLHQKAKSQPLDHQGCPQSPSLPPTLPTLPPTLLTLQLYLHLDFESRAAMSLRALCG